MIKEISEWFDFVKNQIQRDEQYFINESIVSSYRHAIWKWGLCMISVECLAELSSRWQVLFFSHPTLLHPTHPDKNILFDASKAF